MFRLLFVVLILILLKTSFIAVYSCHYRTIFNVQVITTIMITVISKMIRNLGYILLLLVVL